jgi:hypothetical protein
MRYSFRRIAAAAIVPAAVAALALSGAGAASASVAAPVAPAHVAAAASNGPDSSYGCRHYDYGYCSSQEFQAPANLAFAVKAGIARKNQPIITWTYSTSDSRLDFDARNISGLTGTGGPAKTFQYAPNGQRSGYCIGDISDADGQKLVLRHCNGSGWQDFIPTYVDGNYVVWVNANSGKAITDPGFGGEGTQLTAQYVNGNDNQNVEWAP